MPVLPQISLLDIDDLVVYTWSSFSGRSMLQKYTTLLSWLSRVIMQKKKEDK